MSLGTPRVLGGHLLDGKESAVSFVMKSGWFRYRNKIVEKIAEGLLAVLNCEELNNYLKDDYVFYDNVLDEIMRNRIALSRELFPKLYLIGIGVDVAKTEEIMEYTGRVADELLKAYPDLVSIDEFKALIDSLKSRDTGKALEALLPAVLLLDDNIREIHDVYHGDLVSALSEGVVWDGGEARFFNLYRVVEKTILEYIDVKQLLEDKSKLLAELEKRGIPLRIGDVSINVRGDSIIVSSLNKSVEVTDELLRGILRDFIGCLTSSCDLRGEYIKAVGVYLLKRYEEIGGFNVDYRTEGRGGELSFKVVAFKLGDRGAKVLYPEEEVIGYDNMEEALRKYADFAGFIYAFKMEAVNRGYGYSRELFSLEEKRIRIGNTNILVERRFNTETKGTIYVATYDVRETVIGTGETEADALLNLASILKQYGHTRTAWKLLKYVKRNYPVKISEKVEKAT